MKRLFTLFLLGLAVAFAWTLTEPVAPRTDDDLAQEHSSAAALRLEPLPVLQLPEPESAEANDPGASETLPASVRRYYARHAPRRARPRAPPARDVSAQLQTMRDPTLPIANRLTALRNVEVYAAPPASDAPTSQALRQAGITLREWKSRHAYEAAGVDGAEVRALILEALQSENGSTRSNGLVRIAEHAFTAIELYPVIGRAVRSDQRGKWFVAEQILDRMKLSPRTADDLVSDWETAFAEGPPKRRRFLVGLGARLKPKPRRLNEFLHAALADADRDVRASAVNALGRLGMDGSDVGVFLAHATTDPDDRVAQLATEWIGTLRR